MSDRTLVFYFEGSISEFTKEKFEDVLAQTTQSFVEKLMEEDSRLGLQAKVEDYYGYSLDFDAEFVVDRFSVSHHGEGNLDHVVRFLCDLQEYLVEPEVWALQYSDYYDPVCGLSSGGGAIVMYKQKPYYTNTSVAATEVARTILSNDYPNVKVSGLEVV